MKTLAICAVCIFISAPSVNGDVLGPVVGSDSVTVVGDSELVGVANPAGRIDVESGNAVVETNQPSCALVLPETLRKGLVMWLDANTNVVWSEEKGGITEWRDVRETGTDSSTYRYLRAVIHEPDNVAYSHLASVPPTWYDDADNRFNGMRIVDFGEFGSGKWLYAANPDGQLAKVPVMTFLMVEGLHETHGHILADIAGLKTVGGGLNMFYHKQYGSLGTGCLAASNLDSCVMPLGETRLDGERVNPVSTTLPRNSFNILVQNGPGVVSRGGATVSPYFSTFFNHGNYTTNTVNQTANRQGGGLLGEVLIYNRVLSDGERRQIEAYLRAKWFGIPTAGVVDVRQGASLSVDAGSSDVSVSSISGKGTFVKGGERYVRVVDNSAMSDAAIRLDGGSLRLEQLRAPLYVATEPGCTIIADSTSGRYSKGSARDGIVRAIGSGSAPTVLVDPGDLAGRRLQATNALVVLAPRSSLAVPDPPAWARTNLIVNGGFENPALNNNSDNRQINSGDYGWTACGTHPDGAMVARYDSTWYESIGVIYAATNKFGSNICALVGNTSPGNAAISQTITPPVTGTYRLSYYLSRRQSRTADSGVKAPVLVVSLDGVPFHRNCVFENNLFNRNEMNFHSTLTPVLAAGREYTITFAVDDNTPIASAADRAVVLDEIVLAPCEEGDMRIFIPNADMLSFGSALDVSATGCWKSNPGRTFWGLDAEEGSDASFGISMDSTWWSFRDINGESLDDCRLTMFLARGAAVTNTIVAPRAGRVRFFCRYANRSDSYLNGSTPYPEKRTHDHRLEVSVGGSLVGSVVPVSAKLSPMYVDFDIAAGEQELRIACVRTNTADCAVIVCSPELRYLLAEGVSSTSIAQGSTFDGTFNAPSNGFYSLAIAASGPVCQPYVVNGTANKYNVYPACANVMVDGVYMAQIRAQSDELKDFEIRLPHLAAGDHSFRLECGASTFRFCGVSLKPLPMADFERIAGRDTVIDLQEDAKLELRYDGNFRIGRLFRSGERLTGVFSAATHPSWISGPGVLEVRPKGVSMTVR